MSAIRHPEPRSLEQVRAWHEAMNESLFAHRARVLANIRREAPAVESRFMGMSRGEVGDFFHAQRKELDDLSILAMMASAEAAIRADYARRLYRRGGDGLTREYVALRGRLGAQVRASLDEDILEAMRGSGLVSLHLVSRFRDALRLRHWLAHGRYWKLTLGGYAYSLEDVFRIADELIQSLP